MPISPQIAVKAAGLLLLLTVLPSSSSCDFGNDEECATEIVEEGEEVLQDQIHLFQAVAVSTKRKKESPVVAVHITDGRSADVADPPSIVSLPPSAGEAASLPADSVSLSASAGDMGDAAELYSLAATATETAASLADTVKPAVITFVDSGNADGGNAGAPSAAASDSKAAGAKLQEKEATNSAIEHLAFGYRSWRSDPPVSTTMKCLMVLAVQYLSVYGLLVLRRTITQLSGTQRSMEEVVLERTATLTINLLPTLGVLFLGTEMLGAELSRVSSTITGLPPWWADVAMVVAVMASVAVTFFHLLQEACLESIGKFCMILHFVATIVQYSAVAVVIIAALAMQVPYDAWLGGSRLGMSPAVRCLVMLAVMHFAVIFLLKFSMALDRSRLRHPSRLTRAAELAAATQNLSPMLGILFLATHMCSMQMQAESSSEWWQCQVFIYLCTYALLVKTLSCVPLIFWGDLDMIKAAVLVDYVHSTVNSIAELVLYVGMVAITLWIGLQAPGPQLSPSLKALLALSMQFFTICLFLFVAQTADGILRRSPTTELLRDTGAIAILKAAVETVMLFPMICLLFCSMWLRALELSQNKGHPQAWVHWWMYLCMVASFTQLASVLATGAIAGEPAEAVPKSSLTMFTAAEQSQSTSRGWTLAAILCQYVSLACLLVGTAAVICGIFFATPANVS